MVRLKNGHQYKNASLETLMEAAQVTIDAEVSNSTLLSDVTLPHYTPDQLILGRVIGRGGFCVVQELLHESGKKSVVLNQVPLSSPSPSLGLGPGRRPRLPWLRSHSTGHDKEDAHEDASSIHTVPKSHKRSANSVGRFHSHCTTVVKQVEPSLRHQDKLTYLQGWIDIALEARYLAALSEHPHIVRIVGVCHVPQAPPWILLQSLPQRLPKQLTAWMHADRTTRGITGMVLRGQGKARALLIERLRTAWDLAQVLAFVHEHQIVYRDLVRI
jgi:serine/threonine protein kinase